MEASATGFSAGALEAPCDGGECRTVAAHAYSRLNESTGKTTQSIDAGLSALYKLRQIRTESLLGLGHLDDRNVNCKNATNEIIAIDDCIEVIAIHFGATARSTSWLSSLFETLTMRSKVACESARPWRGGRWKKKPARS